MNVAQAVAFVQNNGNEVEQARLAYLLTRQPPSPAIRASLFARQRDDGGWAPFWAAAYSSLDAACFRLAQAEQLGIPPGEPAVRRALYFLAQRQSATGAWEEDEKVASLAPPWATPGDLSACLYLTANCAFWLALWGDPYHQGAARAAACLQTHLLPDGQLPGFAHTHWLAAGLWHKLGWFEPADRVFAYLQQCVDSLPASNLAWLIVTLAAAGVPAAHPLLDKVAKLLAQSQQPDGRWASEDGAYQDVHATLEALRALSLCGRITAAPPGGL